MAEQEKYYIRVPHGPLVEVAEEVYRAYHQEERRGRTLEEKDQRNGLVSYDGLDTGELTGQEMIPDRESANVEDTALHKVMLGRLRRCLAQMDGPERELIQALYFEGLSEREFGKKTGIPQRTINDRKQRTLRRLKYFLEN